MAYDEELADRVRAELGRLDGLTERHTPDGVAFLLHGNAAVWVLTSGGVVVRVDPDETEKLIRTSVASEVEVGGVSVKGWVRVGTNDVRTARQLEPWVRRAVGLVSDLPRRTQGGGDDPSSAAPSDDLRAAGPEQWDELATARAAMSPMPLTGPLRERAAQAVVRALYDVGAVSPAFAWTEWGPEHYAPTLAAIESADLDDVVRVVTTMIRQDRFVDGALDASLADGSFTRAVDRLIVLRPQL